MYKAMSDAEQDAEVLAGWKAIAKFLGRSVRAAQRYERDLGLPVRRIRTADGQSVYAFRREIARWRDDVGERHERQADSTPPNLASDCTEISSAGNGSCAEAPRLTPRRVRPASTPRFVRWFAVAYGSLFGLSVWTELGYEYSRFATLVWTASAVNVLWVGGTILAAFGRAPVEGPRARSWSLLLASLLLLTLCMVWLLPSDHTVQATLTTRSASLSYVKNVLVHFLPVLVFVVPPLHAVIALERLLEQGHTSDVIRFTHAKRLTTLPSGTALIPPSWLALALLACALSVLVGVDWFLDHLVRGPHSGLFSGMLYARTAVWLLLAGSGVWWYATRLDDLKRQAFEIAGRIAQRTSPESDGKRA